jgi:hypothetical protein
MLENIGRSPPVRSGLWATPADSTAPPPIPSTCVPLAPDHRQHVGLEETLDHQHEADRRQQQQERRDRAIW